MNSIRTRLAITAAVLALPFAAALADPPSAKAKDPARVALVQSVRYEPTDFEMDLGPAVPFGEDVLVETFAFPSPYKSSDPERNDTVRGKIFRRKDADDCAVIVLGGWRRDPMTPALAADLAKTGVQAVYLELPFQGQRTPKGKRPGQVTFSDDIDQNLATFVQIAQDVGRIRSWLVQEREVDAKRIGLMGTSLGGFAASTLYGMDDTFCCAGIMLAGSDVATVVFNGNFLTARVRMALEQRGVDEKTFRKRMQVLDPASWANKAKKDGLLFLAAERDSVVPLATVKELAKLYGGAKVEVIPGVDHIAPTAVKKYFHLVAKHLAERLGAKTKARTGESDVPARKE
jgi:dienelactone hydrolase